MNTTQAQLRSGSGPIEAPPPSRPAHAVARPFTSHSGENLLMRELTHRIANDWASAICAVSVAARTADNPHVKTALGNVAKQLYLHAELLRVLRMPEPDATVDAAEYLHRLCHSISHAKRDWMNIRLILAVDPLPMSAERCWRLGMIVYELVTNSVRHAFGNRDGGVIRLDLCRADPLGVCQVSDDGSSRPNVPPGDGLKIVHALVASLDGQLKQEFGPLGSTTMFQFVA